MPILHNGRTYSSKKHPMLEYIFNKYNPNRDITQLEIHFTLDDISQAYRATSIKEPASISNTILDLTRKQNHISSRLPESIYSLGYDLKKKTGTAPNGGSYAGTFVFVDVGNEIQSWLQWSDTLETIEISSSGIPPRIRDLIRNDEGALFSVIDYCNVFSLALYNGQQQVMRVQNPMKWQPNEIDGFYYGNIDGIDTVFPVEAKALTTGDDINLVQLEGGITTIMSKLNLPNAKIVPLAVQMIQNGIRIAVFRECRTGQAEYNVELVRAFKVTFNPVITSWK
jgi:hypothetical protein